MTFDYGQKEDKKFDDASNSIYSQHFSPEYAFILENADSLEAQFKRQPAHLERLYGTFFLIKIFATNDNFNFRIELKFMTYLFIYFRDDYGSIYWSTQVQGSECEKSSHTIARHTRQIQLAGFDWIFSVQLGG